MKELKKYQVTQTYCENIEKITSIKKPETLDEYIAIYNVISSMFTSDYCPEEEYFDRDDFDDDDEYAIAVATKMQKEPGFFESFLGGAKEFFHMENGWLESSLLTVKQVLEIWLEASVLEPYGFFEDV